MSKFKTGDKIKLVDAEGTIDMTEGKVYEIVGVTPEGYPYIIDDVGDQGWWNARRFKLVPEYLTPEQVFKALQDKQELQYMYEYTTGIGDYVVGWRDCSNPQFANILNLNWRIKPVPKTIDYYGTELPKPIDISSLGDSTVVYIPQLHRNSVSSMEVWEVKRLSYYGEALHFSTYEDAKLVIDTIRKPFKQ